MNRFWQLNCRMWIFQLGDALVVPGNVGCFWQIAGLDTASPFMCDLNDITIELEYSNLPLRSIWWFTIVVAVAVDWNRKKKTRQKFHFINIHIKNCCSKTRTTFYFKVHTTNIKLLKLNRKYCLDICGSIVCSDCECVWS